MSTAPSKAPAVRIVPDSTWALVIAVLATVVVVYFQTWRELWPYWMDTSNKTYTHGVLILGISLWLLWRARTELNVLVIEPLLLAIPLVLVLSLSWLVSAHAGLMVVQVALWPFLAASVLLATCGHRVTALLAFPLGYLWFSMPIWDVFNRSLQSMTIIAASVLNRVTGVPARVVGDLVIIPQGRFEIASGCSGLHYLMVALAIAALAGEVHRDPPWARLLMLGVASILALLSNWVRVYTIILAGYLTDMQHYLVRVDHYWFGWALFAVVMALFFFIARRLPISPKRAREAPVAVVNGQRRWERVAAALLVAFVFPAASMVSIRLQQGPTESLVAYELNGFVGPLRPSPVWQPAYAGAAAEVRVAYLSSSGRVLDYYGNLYLRQVQGGSELIGYGNLLFDPAVFALRQTVDTLYETAHGIVPVTEIELELRDGARWLLLYHYRVDNQRMVGRFITQLKIGLRSSFRDTRTGIRAVAAPCTGQCDAVREELALLLEQIESEET